MNYIVLIDQSVIDLEKQVNRKIAQGYVPVGGITFSPNFYVYQSMVKKEVLN